MFPLEAGKLYTPKDISAWLDVPRTTLFRWESVSAIDPVTRVGNIRQYSSENVFQAIKLVKRNITNDVAERAHYGRILTDQAWTELLYRIKVLQDPTEGLHQMRSLAKGWALSERTISLLIEGALALPRGNALRIAVWSVLDQSDKTVKK